MEQSPHLFIPLSQDKKIWQGLQEGYLSEAVFELKRGLETKILKYMKVACNLLGKCESYILLKYYIMSF